MVMVGSPSNKKVARAARTGGGRRRDPNSYSWYALMVVIVIVGTILVVVSRNDRLSTTNYGSTAPLAPSPTRTGDHWVEAFGMYVCDKFVPNINSSNDPYGIATQNDGVIHIHPYERKYAGHNATLGLFAKAMTMKLERDQFSVPGDKTYAPGTKCGDQDGELVVKEWSKASDGSTGKVVRSNPKNLLLKNDAALVLAWVPKGKTDIPLPPSAADLPKIAAADEAAAQGSGGGSTTTSAPPNGSTSTTATTAAPTTTAAP